MGLMVTTRATVGRSSASRRSSVTPPGRPAPYFVSGQLRHQIAVAPQRGAVKARHQQLPDPHVLGLVE